MIWYMIQCLKKNCIYDSILNSFGYIAILTGMVRLASLLAIRWQNLIRSVTGKYYRYLNLCYYHETQTLIENFTMISCKWDNMNRNMVPWQNYTKYIQKKTICDGPNIRLLLRLSRILEDSVLLRRPNLELLDTRFCFGGRILSFRSGMLRFG